MVLSAIPQQAKCNTNEDCVGMNTESSDTVVRLIPFTSLFDHIHNTESFISHIINVVVRTTVAKRNETKREKSLIGHREDGIFDQVAGTKVPLLRKYAPRK